MLSIRNVSHEFSQFNGNGRLRVLNDVSININSGEFVSFLGPSGCGKTTLLRMLAGLEHPSWGQIEIDGEAVSAPSAKRPMVFQEFNLFPWRTALQNIAFPLEIAGIEAESRAGSAKRLMQMVGLQNFENFYPHQLSGGMKQRVGIARALALAPTHLFMDEPFGALDPMIREVMQVELLKVLAKDQKTIVFVTHSVDEAIFLSDRIAIFGTRPGRILSVIDIELPKPRWEDDEAIKASAAFGEYRRYIWSLLKDQVKAALDHGS